MNENNYG